MAVCGTHSELRHGSDERLYRTWRSMAKEENGPFVIEKNANTKEETEEVHMVV